MWKSDSMVFRYHVFYNLKTQENCIFVSNFFMRLPELIFCLTRPSRRLNPAICKEASVTSFTCRLTV